MLNMSIFSNKKRLQELLLQPVITIENALETGFAENLYHQLMDSKAWERQETGENKSQDYRKDFNFKRDHIDLQNPNAPPALTALYAYLDSVEVRQLFSEICGRQCDGFRAAATIFNKGDHISEHNDLLVYEEKGMPNYKRELTFNYYLSKNWNPSWGGNLVWKKPYRVISPHFNTLVLFNVTANSEHWVDPVLIDTETKRLSITGWYLREIKKEKFKLSL